MWKLDAYHHPLPPEERAAGELGVPIQFASNGALQLYQSGPDFSSPNAQIILAWQADAQAGAWQQEAVDSSGDAGRSVEVGGSSFDVSAPGQAPVAPATAPAGATLETILLAELAADTVETLLGDVSDRVSEFLGALVTAAANVGINLSPSRTEGYLALNDPGAKDTATDAGGQIYSTSEFPKEFSAKVGEISYIIDEEDSFEAYGIKEMIFSEDKLLAKPSSSSKRSSPTLADVLAARYKSVGAFEEPLIDTASVLLQQELDDLYGGVDPLQVDDDTSWLATAGETAPSNEHSILAAPIIPSKENGSNDPPSDDRQFFSGFLEGIPQFAVGMAQSAAQNFVYGIPGVGIIYAGYELYQGAAEHGGGIRGAFIAANEQWNPFYGVISAGAGFVKATNDRDARKAGNQAFHLAVGIIAAVDLVRGGLKGGLEETTKGEEEGPSAKLKKDDFVNETAPGADARSVRSLNERLAEHRAKLEAYRADPDAFDNKGFLKDAPSTAVRENIIKGRVKHLEQEIRNFEKQIRDLSKDNGQ